MDERSQEEIFQHKVTIIGGFFFLTVLEYDKNNSFFGSTNGQIMITNQSGNVSKKEKNPQSPLYGKNSPLPCQPRTVIRYHIAYYFLMSSP
jgi:hypothetical protein